MKMITRRSGKRDGFTLMEVITAVFVFLIGIVGVISLFAAAGVFHKGARNKALVSLAVEQVIADIDLQLKNDALRNEKEELKPIKDARVTGFDRFRYDATFTEDGLARYSMVTAEVTLTWREKGKKRGETFDYVFRPGPPMEVTVEAFRREGENAAARRLKEEEPPTVEEKNKEEK
jgi:hypothetical protein